MKLKLFRKIIATSLSLLCACPMSVFAGGSITEDVANTLKSWCCDKETEGWKEFIDEHLKWNAAYTEDYTNSSLLFFAANCANTPEKIEIIRDIFNRLLDKSEKRELLVTIDCFGLSAKECAKGKGLWLAANLIEELEKDAFFDDYPANINNILNCAEYISNMLRPKLDENGTGFPKLKEDVFNFIFYLHRMIGFTKTELIYAMFYIKRYLLNMNTPPVNKKDKVVEVNKSNGGMFIICALRIALKYCRDSLVNINYFARCLGGEKIGGIIQQSEPIFLKGLKYNCNVRLENYKKFEEILDMPVSISSFVVSHDEAKAGSITTVSPSGIVKYATPSSSKPSSSDVGAAAGATVPSSVTAVSASTSSSSGSAQS